MILPGATLKQIRDQTGVRVDIPRRDDAAVANGHATPLGEDEEEPTIPVTITGAQPLALDAQTLIKQGMYSRVLHWNPIDGYVCSHRVQDFAQHAARSRHPGVHPAIHQGSSCEV